MTDILTTMVKTLRALCEAAGLPPCEAFYDDDNGTWFVRPVGGAQGVVTAELPFGPNARAVAELYALAPRALVALCDALDDRMTAHREADAEATEWQERAAHWKTQVDEWRTNCARLHREHDDLVAAHAKELAHVRAQLARLDDAQRVLSVQEVARLYALSPAERAAALDAAAAQWRTAQEEARRWNEAATASQEALTILRAAPRAGQALFNALLTTDPDFAESIRGTDLDPFYHDSRVGMTLRAWLTRADPGAPRAG